MKRIGVTLALTLPLYGSAAELPAEPAPASAASAMRQMLEKRYPNTQFGDIQRSAAPGLWEVRMGAHTAYVTDEGRHFLFGHLYDMQTQTDLTAEPQQPPVLSEPTNRLPLTFAALPLTDAIKSVRGKGERQLAVFSDPYCSYCRALERQLAKLDNVTVYTFLLPLDALHPQASTMARRLWCAQDRSNAWQAYMATGKAPRNISCATPVARNIALAEEAGIHGTPYILFANGAQAAGALDAARLEWYLSQ